MFCIEDPSIIEFYGNVKKNKMKFFTIILEICKYSEICASDDEIAEFKESGH